MRTKSIFAMALACLILGGLSVGCKSTKEANGEGSKKRVKTEVQEYAEKDPALRAWASYTVSSVKYERVAKNTAAAQARNSAAAALKSQIKSSLKDYTNDREIEDAGEIEAKTGNQVNQLVEEIMEYWPEVKWETYDNADGSVTMYVCVEFRGELNKLAAELAKGLNRRLTEDQKTKIDFDQYMFEEQMKKDLEEYRKRQKQGN